MTFRTVTHGTCALGGRHTSETYTAECPALGRSAEERLERFQTSYQGVDSGSQKTVSFAPTDPATSKAVFRHGRAGKSGRPKVPAVEQRRKARERTRTWRARRSTA
jgi:hypothetical protein